MAADMAANSDSTVRNSHCGTSPCRTIDPIASTMCVCGVIGYAGTTLGRHRATASAIAREPSIWSRMNGHPLVRRAGRRHVAFGDFALEPAMHRLLEAGQPDALGQRT